MFPKINPTTTKAWQLLSNHYNEMKAVHMKELFTNDAERFNKFSILSEELVFDYSKNIITEETLQLLLELANECHLPEAIKAMFNGEKINETENRAVLHTALRNFSGVVVDVDGRDIMPDIKKGIETDGSFLFKNT